MPDITLPDGSRKSFPTAVTVAEVAPVMSAKVQEFFGDWGG